MPESAVTVFWRPGCGFCSGLLRSLERIGVEPARRNIWEDEEAAAFVRSVTGGSETVPTVVVGDQAFVNPAPAEVMTALADVAPAEVPDDYEPPTPGPVARTVNRLLGGASPHS